MPVIPPVWRKWIYGVSMATIPVLIGFGWLDDNRAAAIVGLLNAVFIGGMAFMNTSATPVEGDEIEDAAE